MTVIKKVLCAINYVYEWNYSSKRSYNQIIASDPGSWLSEMIDSNTVSKEIVEQTWLFMAVILNIILLRPDF